jgi:DNA-binding response OmpR family regulator
LFEWVRADARLYTVPFIFITARTDDESIQKAKGLGAEDYIKKPFKAEELEASIRGKLLRAAQLAGASWLVAEEPSTTLRMDDLMIDMAAHQVSRAGQVIHLSPTEFTILCHLCQNAGRVVSLDELARVLYPSTFNMWHAQDSIRVHIKNLRKKLEANPTRPRYLQNVRGIGYRFALCDQ